MNHATHIYPEMAAADSARRSQVAAAEERANAAHAAMMAAHARDRLELSDNSRAALESARSEASSANAALVAARATLTGRDAQIAKQGDRARAEAELAGLKAGDGRAAIVTDEDERAAVDVVLALRKLRDSANAKAKKNQALDRRAFDLVNFLNPPHQLTTTPQFDPPPYEGQARFALAALVREACGLLGEPITLLGFFDGMSVPESDVREGARARARSILIDAGAMPKPCTPTDDDSALEQSSVTDKNDDDANDDAARNALARQAGSARNARVPDATRMRAKDKGRRIIDDGEGPTDAA